MSAKRVTAVVPGAALAAVLCPAGEAHAQLGSSIRRYSPATPTISPYLNLLRANNGGIPNYYSFVRPQQLQRQFNTQEQALVREQGAELIRLGNELQEGIAPAAATGTAGWFMTRGARSTFMNTSRYYPEPALRR